MLPHQCFDAIGFKAPDFQEFNHYLDMARLKGHHPSSERGSYAYWAVGEGIELWVAADKQLAQLNSSPHYLGASRVNGRVLEIVDHPTTLEGGVRVHLVPESEDAPHYSFMFGVPDWDLTRPLLKQLKAAESGPLVVSFQLTAFAEELECYDDEASYLAVQSEAQERQRHYAELGIEQDAEDEEYKKDKEMLAPPVHFIPTGLQVAKGEKPLPKASLSGEVVGGHVLRNPITNQQTLCLSLKTLGMTIDMVADPALVKRRPRRHSIVSGHFWLSGRLVVEIEATNKRLRIA